MELPFDTLSSATYIKELSEDVIPSDLRYYQDKMGVPCLSILGCRFLSLCVSMCHPKNIIDIGCGIGASTLAMAKFADEYAYIDSLDANIDRVKVCRKFTEGLNVSVHHSLAVPFLESIGKFYDFAFVDTIKKDYLYIWKKLRSILNSKATVVFDDVLLYGYTSEEEATVPLRYREGRQELKDFLYELSMDRSLLTQIIPIGGGMLLVKLLD